MSSPVIRTAPKIDRQMLVEWYRRNRQRSAYLFGLIDEGAMYERPIPLRHPFVFYQGHLPAFSFLTLNERGLGESPLDPHYEKLFERGIDPATLDDAKRHERQDWPSPEQIAAFAARCDERAVAALTHAKIDDPAAPRLVRAQAAYTILEHEQMHHETLMYIVHRLDGAHKKKVVQEHRDNAEAANDMRAVPAGSAELGADPEDIAFGWDNEFGAHRVEVPAFGMMTYPITNRQWLAFVAAGGPVPPFWREAGGEWMLRCAFEDVPLPLSWPVYVAHSQARAYAQWAGLQLPSEAQYHRAAFGTPGGPERSFPWGEDAPAARHGNFDLQRFDPEPVDAHPSGASAWGIYDLVGNGWEWTSTPFAPFPGFEPMASYPQYSADFFDGQHFVMKGASPVTGREQIRRSFRNWFYDDYPFMYAKFRCVA